MKNILGILLLLSCMLPISMLAQAPLRYLESGGLVIIELESVQNYRSWELDTSRVGYTKDGYLHYKGPNFYNSPGNSLLKFEINIGKAGKYRFQWHSLIAVGQSNTEHNDSWLRFHDASDFYGEKNGLRVYPKGVGKSPNPNGSSSNGWFKIYQNVRNNWTWNTSTSDHDPHDIYVEFDSAGIYTLEISGRSTGHAINRIALYHSDRPAAEALSLGQPESELDQTVSARDISIEVLKIHPTRVDQLIYLQIPGTLGGGAHEAQIINLQGQEVQRISFGNHGNSEVPVAVDQLGSGIYFIRIQNESFFYQGKFIKQ